MARLPGLLLNNFHTTLIRNNAKVNLHVNNTKSGHLIVVPESVMVESVKLQIALRR